MFAVSHNASSLFPITEVAVTFLGTELEAEKGQGNLAALNVVWYF